MVLQVHHERKQPLAVRLESAERLYQSFPQYRNATGAAIMGAGVLDGVERERDG
jgi:hypothetical protein